MSWHAIELVDVYEGLASCLTQRDAGGKIRCDTTTSYTELHELRVTRDWLGYAYLYCGGGRK